MKGVAGARIDEETGLRVVRHVTRISNSHFFAVGKFRGFFGSSWKSQPTRSLSRSERGYFSMKISFCVMSTSFEGPFSMSLLVLLLIF